MTPPVCAALTGSGDGGRPDDPPLLARRVAAYVRAPCFDPPPLPRIAHEVWAACAMGRASALQVAHLVHRDPIIAARVMRLAASARYGAVGHSSAAQPIATLRDAIVRIGFDELLNAVLLLSLARSLYALSTLGALAEESRRHSVAAALAASRLATSTGLASGPRAFLAGLLHDVGEPVVLHAIEHIWRCDRRETPPADTEAGRALVRDLHTAVGGSVADHWQLDLELRVVITRHHDGRPLSDCSPLLRIVRLADGLAGQVVPREDAPAPDALADVPGVPAAALDEVRAELPTEFAVYEEL